MDYQFLVGMDVFDESGQRVKGYLLIAAIHFDDKQCNPADRAQVIKRRFGFAGKHPLLAKRAGQVRSVSAIRRLLRRERMTAEVMT